MNLRQAHACRFDGDAVVAGEGGFQTAAQRRSVDGADNRLVEVFDIIDHLGEAGFLHRLAEFPDIGAGDEGAALAINDRNSGAVSAANSLRRQKRPSRTAWLSGGIHRRIVDGDNRDRTGIIGHNFIGNDFGHVLHRLWIY